MILFMIFLSLFFRFFYCEQENKIADSATPFTKQCPKSVSAKNYVTCEHKIVLYRVYKKLLNAA
jgi:hypothetical protein